MGLDPRYRFEPVSNKGQDRTQTLFSSSAATGQIDNQGFAAESCETSREPGHRIVLSALCAHGLGYARRFPFDDRPRGFRSQVARAEACAANGEDQGRVLADPLCQTTADPIGLIGHESRLYLSIVPMLTQKRDNGRTGSVDGYPLRTAIRDRENREEHEVIVEAMGSAIS
jgi:hypothetical protein